MTHTAYFNGEFCHVDDIKLSPLDRGFLFGDGVYEMIPVYEGWVCALTEHLERLENSLRGLEITNPYNDAEWATIIQQLVSNAGLGDNQRAVVYVQISRGVDAVRHHLPTTELTPTVFAYVQYAEVTPLLIRQHGVSAAVREDQRWARCDIKATALLGHVMHRLQAPQTNETILVTDGYLREGASSNVFIVKDEKISTPPVSEHILSGITRSLVIEQLKNAELDIEERPISVDELKSADEIWITSSTREIYPVTLLDDVIVGRLTHRQPGPFWHIAYGCYQDMVGKALEKDEAQTLLELPCAFPLKVFGKQHDEFPTIVRDIVERHVPARFIGPTDARPSSNGKYLAVTIKFNAHSKSQLDALYQDISACPDVVMAL